MTYPPGFERAWSAYPHYESRSYKRASFEVWGRLELEEIADRVVAWIEACKSTRDWTNEGGKYVPGMQVWLKRPDFLSDPPTSTEKTRNRATSPSSDRRSELLNEELAAGKKLDQARLDSLRRWREEGWENFNREVRH